MTSEEIKTVFAEIFTASGRDEEIKTFLKLLSEKGAGVEELLGATLYLREHGETLSCRSKQLVDTCGTGGDKKNTFNFSTAVAFVLAGCGCRVAKHGNRAVSSQSGSADVLSELNININADKKLIMRCIDEVGIGFLFAPNFYPLMKKLSPIRRSLPHGTIFNLLGPLLNPARASNQLIGVTDNKFAPKMAEVLKKLGTEQAVFVHAHDGMDEVSLTGLNNITTLIAGEIRQFVFDPRESGYAYCQEVELKGGRPSENAARLRRCLKGHSQPLDHVVHINAAWGLVAAGKASSFMEGLILAQQSISSGAAYRKLEELAKICPR